MEELAAIRDLRRARNRWGLSQEEIAKRIGTTQAVVARLESGQSDPRLSTVLRYAEAVHARVDVRLPEPNRRSLTKTGDIVRSRVADGDASNAFRDLIQFLDDLDPLSATERQAAIQDEPAATSDPRWDAALAGIAEYAAHRFGLRTPGWATAPGRFLPYAWYPIETILGRQVNGLAVLAFTNAAPELANRGVFIDRSSLVSV